MSERVDVDDKQAANTRQVSALPALISRPDFFREYVVNANEPVLTLQEQDIVKHLVNFTRLPRRADKSNSQFALNTYSRFLFGLDSQCPTGPAMLSA